MLRAESGIDVRLEQQARSFDAPPPVGTELTAAQDEARHQTKHVVTPRADDGLVEIVDVEHDGSNAWSHCGAGPGAVR